jgi:UDP-N-acetylglucosamine 2-epimerase
MKIVTIVGARPQFVKAAELSRELRKEHTEIMVHTGQHYDDNLSAIFFDELDIPEPDYNLGIGSGSHGAQTGAILAAIEQVLVKEQPDWVMVYGDTNSTLAGALAAVKLHIPLAHVEAGLRSFNREMPEEHNRVLTDHCADLLFCPTQTAVDNLAKEGITKGVHLVGDLMYDALMWAVAQGKNRPDPVEHLGLHSKGYLLTTVHRAENTDNPERLADILKAFNLLEEPIVWPIHPRTRKKLAEVEYQPAVHVHLIEPVGPIEMAGLENNARLILTDSGGVQKEAFWLGVPCLTLRNETEWVETVQSGWNFLVSTEPELILAGLQHSFPSADQYTALFGNRQSAHAIAQIISQGRVLLDEKRTDQISPTNH